MIPIPADEFRRLYEPVIDTTLYAKPMSREDRRRARQRRRTHRERKRNLAAKHATSLSRDPWVALPVGSWRTYNQRVW